MTAEFTPFKAKVEDGIATYSRSDIVIGGSFKVATWGQIDLVKDEVNMILGITAETLDKAFGLENLEPDYVLEIPMKGPSDDV